MTSVKTQMQIALGSSACVPQDFMKLTINVVGTDGTMKVGGGIWVHNHHTSWFKISSEGAQGQGASSYESTVQSNIHAYSSRHYKRFSRYNLNLHTTKYTFQSTGYFLSPAEPKGRLNTPCLPQDICLDHHSDCDSSKICVCVDTHFMKDNQCC